MASFSSIDQLQYLSPALYLQHFFTISYSNIEYVPKCVYVYVYVYIYIYIYSITFYGFK